MEQQKFFDALYFAGRICFEMGTLDKARRYFRKVLSDAPEHKMAQRDSRALHKKIEEAAVKEKVGSGLMGRFLKR
jgi:TolA-binding protein